MSKTGPVFATGPTARTPSGVSMVKVDTKTGETKPYPDTAWNTIRWMADGKPEWGVMQALWDDSANHLWALESGIAAPGQIIAPKVA